MTKSRLAKLRKEADNQGSGQMGISGEEMEDILNMLEEAKDSRDKMKTNLFAYICMVKESIASGSFSHYATEMDAIELEAQMS